MNHNVDHYNHKVRLANYEHDKNVCSTSCLQCIGFTYPTHVLFHILSRRFKRDLNINSLNFDCFW